MKNKFILFKKLYSSAFAEWQENKVNKINAGFSLYEDMVRKIK